MRAADDELEISRRALLSLFALAFVASIAVGTHGLVYWDAGDYVVLSLRGGVSGLLLGRPLFLAISSSIARASLRLGLHASHVEPLLRYVWTAASATAAPLLALLARRVGMNAGVAIVAGMSLALSPSFAHTAHQVLTDGPALALSIAALVVACHPRPTATRAAMAGALLACAIATRETAVVHGLAMTLLLARARDGSRRRATLAVFVCISLLFVIVIASHGGTIASLRGWLSAMQQSSASHGLGVREVAISIGWLLALGPIAVIVGAFAIARDRDMLRGDRGVVIVPAAIATVALLFYPDGSFSPRYLLATAPIAFLLAAAPLLSKRPRVALIALFFPLLAVPFATRKARAIAQRADALETRLAQVPDGALVVPGHYCPQVGVFLATRDPSHPPRIELLCPGWSWPKDAPTLEAKLDAARCSGRSVVLDLADEAWVGAREDAPRAAVRTWAARFAVTDVAGFTMVRGGPCAATP